MERHPPLKSLALVHLFFHLLANLIPVRHLLQSTTHGHTIHQHEQDQEDAHETGDAIYLLTTDEKHLLHER